MPPSFFISELHMNSPRIITLTPPIISPAHIKEKISCIRGHRERIFEISARLHNDKIICHNYGHGGAGWTFLFGCVNKSIAQLEELIAQHPHFNNKPITIIGAGCYGLLTAILLKNKEYNVCIVAKEREKIPSHNAAGFFFPRPRKVASESEKELFLSLGIESYKTYLAIINGSHPFIKQGPKLIPAYFGLDVDDPEFTPYIAQGLMQPPEKVIVSFSSNKKYELMEYQTLFINPSIIMQELIETAHSLNIPITTAQINSFEEITDPIIINCAGLGAKKLADDPRMIPVQGHLITLSNQPPIDQLNYLINVKVVSTTPQGTPRDEMIYFAPKEEGILGITFIRGQDDPLANQHEFDRLIDRCQQFFG
jgi:D-amino-acid oxidase